MHFVLQLYKQSSVVLRYASHPKCEQLMHYYSKTEKSHDELETLPTTMLHFRRKLWLNSQSQKRQVWTILSSIHIMPIAKAVHFFPVFLNIWYFDGRGLWSDSISQLPNHLIFFSSAKSGQCSQRYV